MLWSMLNNPLEQLRFAGDKKAVKRGKEVSKEDNLERLAAFSLRRMITEKEIKEAKEHRKQEQI